MSLRDLLLSGCAASGLLLFGACSAQKPCCCCGDQATTQAARPAAAPAPVPAAAPASTPAAAADAARIVEVRAAPSRSSESDRPEVRVALFWDAKSQTTSRQIGTRRVKSDEELQAILQSAHDDFVRLGHSETPVTIDASKDVPWREIVNVLNLCKRAGVEHVEFAFSG